LKIEIYSDVVCPWCYIGERRLERALSALPDRSRYEVVYRPFQLDPTAPVEPTPMREFLLRKFGPGADRMKDHVAGVARAEGIQIDFDRALVANTFAAHMLLGLAEREFGAQVQRKLAHGLFQAHFERGSNIADPSVLTELAAAAGMDADRVDGFLSSAEGGVQTRSEIEEGLNRGIRAVPTFVFDGRHAVEGAQPTSTLLQVLEQLAAESSPVPDEPVHPGSSACIDETCTP
jgi:predicted DsbA family dithiol-disulfide isomerase